MFTISSEQRLRRYSALKGNKQSQMELAIQHYNGEGVIKDQEKALHLFKKATEESNELAVLRQLQARAQDNRLFKTTSPTNENNAPQNQSETSAKTMS